MVRTADLPDLGAVTDDSTLVSDHAGTGAFRASAMSTYIASKQRGLHFGYGPPMPTNAVGDGVADDSTAITAAFASSADVALPPGTYRISNNITIGSGKRLVMAAGAQLSVDSGKTVTINGLIDAPLLRIFSGAGSVVGLRQVFPEWWGAVGDGTGDDQPALAAAHTCVQASRYSDGGRPSIFLTRTQYQVARTWTIVPTSDINLAVIGNGTILSGTRILAATTFSPAGPVVLIDGSTGTIAPIADWQFCGIGILPKTVGAGAANIGLQIGSTTAGKTLSGVQESLVEDVYINNFANGLIVNHCRLIQFNRVSVWNDGMAGASNCILIQQSGGFTGDMTFNECQWVAQKLASHVGLAIVSNVGPFGISPVVNNIAGLRFNGCIGYYCDNYIRIDCTAGSHVNDIWFNAGCQYDGGAINSIYLQCSGSGSVISDIHFDHQYVDGADADMITISTSSSGVTRNVWITDNWLAQATGTAVKVTGVNNFGIHIRGNAIEDCVTTPFGAINVAGVFGGTIMGNVLTHTGAQTCAYLASISVNSNYVVCTNNASSGISTTGVIQNLGATNSVFVNNV